MPPVDDLRPAIETLRRIPRQYLETDHGVGPNAELAGVYRRIGAGGTVMRPTRIGPAMMFNNIKGSKAVFKTVTHWKRTTSDIMV